MKETTKKAAPATRTPVIPGTYAIWALVFGGGATGMVLELVGARLLAPYFGNSLFVWTSLIGVLLGFMSLGYFFGGRLADRHLDAGYLFWILMGASVSVAVIAIVGDTILPMIAKTGSVKVGAVLAAMVLFAIPSTLLGMVSPYCIRLRMHSIEDSGATVGTLYALSTVGSIVGTFAAGFWLIAVLGTHALMMLISGALAVLSLLVVGKGMHWKRFAAFGVVIMLLLGASVANAADTIDTQYDRYFLRTITDPASGRPLIGLSRDSISAESVSYGDNGDPYRFEYYNYFDMAAAMRGGAKKVLVIGGGTFSYPRFYVAAHPTSTVDVVEIDPALYGIAKKDFGYKDDPRIKLDFEDGRTFLNHASGTYDMIIVDAFKSKATVPYQLTTQETWKHCYDLLAPNGVLVMNVIASPTDSRKQFFDSLYATIESVFPQVAAFHVQDDGEGGLRNTSIIASKDPNLDISATVAKLSPTASAKEYKNYQVPASTKLLTDDFAPVDQYLLGL